MVFLTLLLGAVVVPVVGSSPASATDPANYTLTSDPSGFTYAVSFGDTYLAVGASTTLTVTVTDTSTNQPVAGQDIGEDIGQGSGYSGWIYSWTNSSGVATFLVTMQSSSVLKVYLENYTQGTEYGGADDYFSLGFSRAGQNLQINLAPTCPSGSYSHSGACIEAGPGHYAIGGTSSVLGSCAAGYYQSLIAQSSCLPADIGYYVPFSQATAQLPAPAGSYVSVTGASAPSVCAAGYYQSLIAQSSCLPADIGYYVPFSQATAQLPAPVGSYVSVTGASAPSVCPTGSTTTSTGQSACVSTTPPIVYSKPTAPSAVSAVMTNGSATVSFSSGSSGNLPTYNQIDMYINGVLAGNVCNVVGASSCPISNLGPDAVFTFTVTAINSKGSAVSAVSNAVSYASPSVALPTTTSTTTTTLPPVKLTITCVKGVTSKKVTAVSPVCPAGFKKK